METPARSSQNVREFQTGISIPAASRRPTPGPPDGPIEATSASGGRVSHSSSSSNMERFGGEVAAPVATEIVRRYFDEIAPSEREAPRLGLVRHANLRVRGPARLKPVVLRNAPRELSRKTR